MVYLQILLYHLILDPYALVCATVTPIHTYNLQDAIVWCGAIAMNQPFISKMIVTPIANKLFCYEFGFVMSLKCEVYHHINSLAQTG